MEEYKINNKDTHTLMVVSYFLLPQEKKAVFKGFQITWYNMYNSTVSRKYVQKKSDDDYGGFQQQSPQRLIDRYMHMNSCRNCMNLLLKPLQVV